MNAGAISLVVRHFRLKFPAVFIGIQKFAVGSAGWGFNEGARAVLTTAKHLTCVQFTKPASKASRAATAKQGTSTIMKRLSIFEQRLSVVESAS